MSKQPQIHYTKPSITELEVQYATDAAANGWGERCYAYISRFESEFAAHLGVPFAIATSSCTGALHMGLAALGLGLGDEVVLDDTNWIATAAPIAHLGATTVFADVLPDSWCIDPDRAEQAITPRTKAIIATHIYGNLCDMDALFHLGASRGIPVIEDAAEAIGSAYRGNRAGSIGCFGAFSFHGTKTMTTGEGGMFVTSDPLLHERVLTLSNHGRSRAQTKQFWPDMIGFKYKMSNVQAAIGCAQLQRIEELTARKREIFAKYRQALGGLSGVSMNPEPEGMRNGYWMPTVVFAPETGVTSERLTALFKERNIDARVFFSPLSSLGLFAPQPGNTVAAGLARRAMNLPSYHDMSDEDIKRVAATVRHALGL